MKYEQFTLFHVHLRRGLDINRRLRFVYDRRDVKHFTALSRVYEPALPDFMNGISISWIGDGVGAGPASGGGQQ